MQILYPLGIVMSTLLHPHFFIAFYVRFLEFRKQKYLYYRSIDVFKTFP